MFAPPIPQEPAISARSAICCNVCVGRLQVLQVLQFFLLSREHSVPPVLECLSGCTLSRPTSVHA